MADFAELNRQLIESQEENARLREGRGLKEKKIPFIPPTKQFVFPNDGQLHRALYINEYGEEMTAVGPESRMNEINHGLFKSANARIDKNMPKWRRIKTMNAWVIRGRAGSPTAVSDQLVNVTPQNPNWEPKLRKQKEKEPDAHRGDAVSIKRSLLTALKSKIPDRLPGVRSTNGKVGDPRFPVLITREAVALMAHYWKKEGISSVCDIEHHLVNDTFSRYQRVVKSQANVNKKANLQRKMIKLDVSDVETARERAREDPQRR